MNAVRPRAVNAPSLNTPSTRALVAVPKHAEATARVVPAELGSLFEESPKMKASFQRLDDRDRSGFVTYIEEAKTPATRERRAALVAMSLIGLARDLPDDAS